MARLKNAIFAVLSSIFTCQNVIVRQNGGGTGGEFDKTSQGANDHEAGAELARFSLTVVVINIFDLEATNDGAKQLLFRHQSCCQGKRHPGMNLDVRHHGFDGDRYPLDMLRWLFGYPTRRGRKNFGDVLDSLESEGMFMSGNTDRLDPRIGIEQFDDRLFQRFFASFQRQSHANSILQWT